MSDLVGDIKKIDEEKIKEGREVLLKYLAEVDQKTSEKVKPAEKKSLDSIIGKSINLAPAKAPLSNTKIVNAEIDFVKDFKTAEPKFSKPITEISQEAAVVSPVVAEPIAPPRAVSEPEKMAVPQAEIMKTTPVIEEKPATRGFFSFKKKKSTELKKIINKKRRKKEREHRAAEENNAKQALDFAGKIFLKFLSAITIVAVFYFIFCLSLYTFSFDNRATRLITKIFPVPAFITQYGAVNYYDYLDAKNAIMDNQKDSDQALGKVLASIEAREKLIKRSILIGIAKDYGLAGGLFNGPEAEITLQNKLALLIVADPSINQDNLRKLRAIKSSLLAGADFVLTANSFGLQAKTEYFTTDSVKEKFGQKALELAAGSTIETTSVKQGYYVFQFFNQQGGLTGFKYIFVPARTLEMIMAEKFKATDLIILAN